jgi:hypothetical protein
MAAITNEAKPFKTVWVVNGVCHGAELSIAEPLQRRESLIGQIGYNNCRKLKLIVARGVTGFQRFLDLTSLLG